MSFASTTSFGSEPIATPAGGIAPPKPWQQLDVQAPLEAGSVDEAKSLEVR